MRLGQRPLRELCKELTIYEIVKHGLPHWECSGFCSAKLLGPEAHGIRVRWEYLTESVDIYAKLYRDAQGRRIGTLRITGAFPGYAWVDEVGVKIPPFRHWIFRCQSCNQPSRSLFWPPYGDKWACRKCHHVRYPDARRLNTLPPKPDADDDLDRIERDIRRLRLIRNRGKRLRLYTTKVRSPDYIVAM
jgi:hypothetical protein